MRCEEFNPKGNIRMKSKNFLEFISPKTERKKQKEMDSLLINYKTLSDPTIARV